MLKILIIIYLELAQVLIFAQLTLPLGATCTGAALRFQAYRK